MPLRFVNSPQRRFACDPSKIIPNANVEDLEVARGGGAEQLTPRDRNAARLQNTV